MLLTLLATSSVLAGPWFSEPLSYWDDSPYGPLQDEVEDEVEQGSQAGLEVPRDSDFDWSLYEDPENKAFWAEGDFVPSEPMMALVRDPTPENAARYMEWQKKKLDVAARISTLLQGPVAPPVSWDGVTVVYFYARSCPHCQRSTPVVLRLEQLGATVLPVYLDAPSPQLPSSVPFTEQMQSLVQLTGTPTFVLSTETGARSTVRGFADMGRLEAELRTLQGENQ